MGQPRPLFIIGVARSGTNLIARMLGELPGIAMALDPLMPLFRAWRNAILAANTPGEMHARFDPVSPFQDYYFDCFGPAMLDAVLKARADFVIAPNAMKSLRKAVMDRAALEMPQLAAQFKEWSAETIGVLFDDALRTIAEHLAKSAPLDYVGCKELWVAEYARPLARAYPEARFVAIHRDPRSVVASLARMAYEDESQAAHSISYMRHWRKHTAVTLTLERDPVLHGRFLNLQYEALVSAPRELAERVCDFLGVAFDPVMLAPTGPDGKQWIGNSSYGPVEVPIDVDLAERWRSVLSPAEVRVIEFLCGPEMNLIGYASEASNVSILEIWQYFLDANRMPGSWRSDSGDPVEDIGFELLRHELLRGVEGSAALDDDLVRRCFLFPWVFDTLRQGRHAMTDIPRKGERVAP